MLRKFDSLKAARFFMIIAALTLIGYPGIARMATPLACLFVLCNQSYYRSFKSRLICYPFLMWLIAFIALFLIGIFYSEAPLHVAFKNFAQNSKFLYLLFILPLFAQYRWRRLAMNVFILSIFIDIVITLIHLHLLKTQRQFIAHHFYPGGYDAYAIAVSVIVAFVSYVLADRALDKKNKKSLRGFYALLFFIAVYTLFFKYIERSGQLVFLALLMFLFWQKMRWKGMLAAVIIVPLLSVSFFFISTTFHQRLIVGYQEIVHYIKTDGKTIKKEDNDSMGWRMAAIDYSWKIIKAHPFFGAGTGSFATAYANIGGPEIKNGFPVGEPQNDYLFIAEQIGIVGLIVFLMMLIMQFRATKYLPVEEKHLAQALIITISLAAVFNGTFFISLTGLTYIIFSGVFFAAINGPKTFSPSHSTQH